MAQMHSTVNVHDSVEYLVHHPEVAATPESMVELAKNTLNPMKCEWGAGTKAECGSILGSWALLRKHLYTVHGNSVRDRFFQCSLPKCNQRHPSCSALMDHIDSAHLSCLTFRCPISGCKTGLLRGIELLLRHYEKHHKDNADGKSYHVSVGQAGMTWKPFAWSQSLDDFVTTRAAKEAVYTMPPALPKEAEIDLGTILVPPVGLKKSEKMMEWLQEGLDNWLPSKPNDVSQSLGLLPNQAKSPITQRKRTKVKQLEKVKEQMKEEDDDDETKVILDDLVGSGGTDDLMNHLIGGIDRRLVGATILRGVGPSVRRPPLLEGGRDAELTQKIDGGVIIGQRSKVLMTDLSRPQPMVMVGLAGYPESARATKSITFEMMAKKMDKLNEGELVDPARLLHDISL